MTDNERQLHIFGWEPVTLPEQVIIDGVTGIGFQFGRAWSSEGGRFRALPSEGYLYALLPVEGFGVVDYDGEQTMVEQNHLILLDGAASITVDTPRDVARYIWRLRPQVLRSRFFRNLYGQPLRLDADVWRPLASLINAQIATSRGSHRHSGNFMRANEHLPADLVDTHVRGYLRRSSNGSLDPVLSHAQFVIERDHARQNLTVRSLAREVGVSERTLRRKYAALGTTPRLELERRRAISALSLMEVSSANAREVAEQAGFTSVGQMNAACQRMLSQDNALQRALDRARIVAENSLPE